MKIDRPINPTIALYAHWLGNGEYSSIHARRYMPWSSANEIEMQSGTMHNLMDIKRKIERGLPTRFRLLPIWPKIPPEYMNKDATVANIKVIETSFSLLLKLRGREASQYKTQCDAILCRLTKLGQPADLPYGTTM